jgi:hypothetical protein
MALPLQPKGCETMDALTRMAMMLGTLALGACAGGSQYSIATAMPGNVVLAQDAGAAADAQAPATAPIFASQQVIALEPGQSFVFGGIPGQPGSGLLPANLLQPLGGLGSMTGGLVNALVPADRVAVSVGAGGYNVGAGVQPGNALGTGGTLTTTLTTPNAGLVPVSATSVSIPTIVSTAQSALSAGNLVGAINSVVATGTTSRLPLLTH